MADNNIIFIGMPAVGKSTVGVVIAKRLGYRFVDTDILIRDLDSCQRIVNLQSCASSAILHSSGRIPKSLQVLEINRLREIR